MLKHCILGFDYSESWQKTCDRLPSVVQMAGIHRLTIVHVVDTTRRMSVEDSEAAAAGHLKDLAANLGSELGIEVDYEVRRGFAATELHEAARRHDANGIIVLNQSHSAGRAFFYGNITLNLARITRVPLLILAADGPAVEPSAPVLLATDGSAPARVAQRCFEHFLQDGRQGMVVWVKTEHDDDEATITNLTADLISRHGQVVSRHVKGDAIQQIVKAAETEQAALVILGKRGTTPLQDLMIGSTAEGVARESRQPVLIIPANTAF
ncbi:Nucleotide-binding universal stress protein, UspA family [Halopseudomonas litoralis]|uniref:Nucleotide-binding universal stress protein, UspA family n=1 Tax=Halopseudomonas litoralis TaxID=797277 RepID=A0A1H1V304_9GAMM|nr:universal stress protein [Halopseudomonas litoralis]SDS79092.1 Nucleotide-binding universal stress protein, UspA family [Halopseudomonas litoralis]